MGSISAKGRAVALGCSQWSAMPRNAVLKKVTLWFCVPLAGRLEPSPGVPEGQTSGCASHAASEHTGCDRRARMRANSSAHEQERRTRTSPIARMRHNWCLACSTELRRVCRSPYTRQARKKAASGAKTTRRRRRRGQTQNEWNQTPHCAAGQRWRPYYLLRRVPLRLACLRVGVVDRGVLVRQLHPRVRELRLPLLRVAALLRQATLLRRAALLLIATLLR